MRDHVLEWYFASSDGDLGLRAMSLEPTTHGEGSAPQGISEHAYEAATRYRVIAEAIQEIEPWHRRTLSRYYSVVPPAVRRIYGGLGDVLGVVLGRADDHGELASMLIQARDDKTARERVEKLKADATVATREAHEAYRTARDRLQRVRELAREHRRQQMLDDLLRGAA